MTTKANCIIGTVVVALGVFASACGRGGDGAEVAGTDVTQATTATTATTVPPPTTTTVPTQVTYVVQSGDSLSVIASRFGVPVADLANFNAITDVDSLQVGQQLAIPPTTVAP